MDFIPGETFTFLLPLGTLPESRNHVRMSDQKVSFFSTKVMC